LRDVVVPHRLRERGPHPLRILSAGCSTGEEPYSIALSLHEHSAAAARAVIVAADINAASVSKARRGKYSAWALRQTPDAPRSRWFTAAGNDFELAKEIRDSVVFV